MATRVKDVLRFVTVWHPEDYLRCKAVDLQLKPHHTRPRAVSTDRRKYQHDKEGFELKPQFMDDGTERVGHGSPVERYRGLSIPGKLLLPFFDHAFRPEPILIYVPDEVEGKAKWRCELRTIVDWRIQLQDQYPDGFEMLPAEVRLSDTDLRVLWDSLRASTFRITGLWVNPSHSLELPNRRALNLGLGPIRGHLLRPADLEVSSDDKRCWIEYTKDISE